MSKRARYYVWLAVGAVAGLVYERISRDWSFGTFYAGLAGVVTVVGLIGLLWTSSRPMATCGAGRSPDPAFPRERLPDWRA